MFVQALAEAEQAQQELRRGRMEREALKAKVGSSPPGRRLHVRCLRADRSVNSTGGHGMEAVARGAGLASVHSGRNRNRTLSKMKWQRLGYSELPSALRHPPRCPPPQLLKGLLLLLLPPHLGPDTFAAAGHRG